MVSVGQIGQERGKKYGGVQIEMNKSKDRAVGTEKNDSSYEHNGPHCVIESQFTMFGSPREGLSFILNLNTSNEFGYWSFIKCIYNKPKGLLWTEWTPGHRAEHSSEGEACSALK